MAACTDNIRAIATLRGLLAHHIADVSREMKCSRVLASELEEMQFLYNALEIISRRVCTVAAPGRLELTFSQNYDPDQGDPAEYNLIITDGASGVATNSPITAAQNIAERLAQIVQVMIDDRDDLDNPTTPALMSWYSNGNRLVLNFKQGYEPQWSLNLIGGIESEENIVTALGDPTATYSWEVGAINSCGDCKDIRRAIQWLEAKLLKKCGKKIKFAPVGPCPPDGAFDCSQFNQGMLDVKFYNSLDSEQNSPLGADLERLWVGVNSPNIASIIYPATIDFKVRSYGGSVTEVQFELYSGAEPWPVGTYVPVGGAISPITGNELYELDGLFNVLTTRGNVCQIVYGRVFGPLACAVPGALSFSGTTDSSTIVSWSESLGAFEYRIRYRRLGEVQWTEETPVESPHEISGLEDGVTYEVQLGAECVIGGSAWGPSYQFTTVEIEVINALNYIGNFLPAIEGQSCPMPTQIVIGTAVDQLTVSWNPEPLALSYDLRYRLITEQGWTEVLNVSSPHVISSLIEASFYEIQIRSQCQADQGVWSPPYLGITQREVLCSNVGPIDWDLTWNLQWDGTKWLVVNLLFQATGIVQSADYSEDIRVFLDGDEVGISQGGSALYDDWSSQRIDHGPVQVLGAFGFLHGQDYLISLPFDFLTLVDGTTCSGLTITWEVNFPAPSAPNGLNLQLNSPL